jgi:thiamine-monophosphate kinase
VSAFRESEFIAWTTEGMTGRLPVGPGDDAAVLSDGTVIAVDAVVEGVHFESGTDPALVARKALGRPLSDLCAMGARGELVFVAALLPPGTDGPALARALNESARSFGVTLAGGDTKATAPRTLALAVTAVGRCRQGGPWTRSGGRPGDELLVSGPLGGAGSGRHLRVSPRADVVEALVASGCEVHACIDISDGLGRNLPLLCAASGLGARVRAGEIPVHEDVAADRDRLAAALEDGEDFELLLAVPPGTPRPAGLVTIGALTEGPAIVLEEGSHQRPWPDCGYEHVF